MFQNLSDKILDSVKKIQGKDTLTEENLENIIKEIRLSFLDADVNFKVVKSFITKVKEKALGEEVLKSVSPDQQFIKIIHDELLDVLGTEATPLKLEKTPATIMFVGLQGVGKTTSSAKLALHLTEKQQKKVGLVPLDVYRPAAIEQLQTLGKQINIPCFDTKAEDKPKNILKQAQKWANENGLDTLILDTAGRLQIDEVLMNELNDLKKLAQPDEILLVADAMLGQQSVNVASGFNDQLGLSGMILTKLDGDARGGAALSIRQTLGIPIKFYGSGEKVTDLEIFHPERLVTRILDQGDVVTLVEKAQEIITEDEAMDTAKKMAKNQFTFEDFLSQIKMMRRMGGMEGIMGMMPGMGQIKKQMKDMPNPEKEIKRIEAIIFSMTPAERREPRILNGSRKMRIAKGSGNKINEVNKVIRQFEQMKKMMSQLMKGGLGGKGFPF